jgi:hypothetical protein
VPSRLFVAVLARRSWTRLYRVLLRAKPGPERSGGTRPLPSAEAGRPHRLITLRYPTILCRPKKHRTSALLSEVIHRAYPECIDMGDIRGSLYDLFGYFIPGLTAGVGLGLALWTLTGKGTLNLDVGKNPSVLVGLAVLLYVLGHIVQAIANAIGWLRPFSLDVVLTEGYSAESPRRPKHLLFSTATLEAVDRTLLLRFGETFQQLPPRDRFAFIDEGRAIGERDGDREVYIYHSGFYRGMIISLIALLVGLLSRFLMANTCVNIAGSNYCLGRLETVTLAFLVIGSLFASWSRFRRFEEYRLVRAVMLWLAITNYAGPNSQTKE